MDFNNEIIKVKQPVVSKRPQMVAKELKHILSNMFLKSQVRHLKLFDKNIIISDIIVTSDLSLAKVYILPQQQYNNQEIIDALNELASFFKYNFGKRLRIKNIPRPIFYLDDILARVAATDEMFKKI